VPVTSLRRGEVDLQSKSGEGVPYLETVISPR
jgi:hypothetical protein